MSICWLALSTACPATKPLVTKERAAQVSALCPKPEPEPSRTLTRTLTRRLEPETEPGPEPSPNANANANAHQKASSASEHVPVLLVGSSSGRLG